MVANEVAKVKVCFIDMQPNQKLLSLKDFVFADRMIEYKS